jgi:hypothetical protein
VSFAATMCSLYRRRYLRPSDPKADCYSVDSDSVDDGIDRRLHYFRKTVPFLNRRISNHLLCLISGQFKHRDSA